MYHKFSGGECPNFESRFVPKKGITRHSCNCGRHEELVSDIGMVKVDYRALSDLERQASYDRHKA